MPFQVYHSKEELLADKSKLMVVALNCPRKVYREARSLGVGHCCYMAEVIEEVKAKSSETEIQSISLEQQASSAKGKKRKNFDQSNDKNTEKVRLPYSCSFSSSPIWDLPCPCLAKKKKKKKTTSILTHSLKCSFPSSFTNVFLYDIVFLTDTREH